MCRAEFGVFDDGLEAVVWRGDYPETVFEQHLNRFNIYLARESDRWQLMYSGAHEASHRACSGGKNKTHWADELFAVHFSLLFLGRIGEVTYADRNRVQMGEQGKGCSVADMLATVDRPLPDGLYGRVYLVSQELIEVWAGSN
jgi:hypothetical protein